MRIELLDATCSHPIQSWEFHERTQITIGRSSERDIAIADISVSRQHVELNLGEEGWTLHSLGRSGVLLDGQPIQTLPMGEETVFRLGSGGPLLRATINQDEDSMTFSSGERQATMATTQVQVLMLDDLETKDRDEKVGEIVNSDFFRLIKEKAHKLRKTR